MDDQPANFRHEEWDEPESFQRDGNPAYFDQCRQMLVPATPEEEIRQKFIQYLFDEVGVPAGHLATELPVSKFKARKHGRADVVGFAVEGDRFVPLFVARAHKSQTNTSHAITSRSIP